MRARHVARWWVLMAVIALSIVGTVATLRTTRRLIPIWRWVHNVSPEGWSASAAWFAVFVGLATVLVGGRYAKQQVAKAQEQIGEAQAARKAQAEQARAALETQVRLADLQAQPVVVIYTELHSEELQFIEIVVKNFGLTPAYDVKIVFDPELKASPNLVSEGRLAEVAIPQFPILAPNQEWRTGWDHYPSRLEYANKVERLSRPEGELDVNEKLEVEFLQSQKLYPLEPLTNRHDVVVTFSDDSGKVLTTRATLDSDLYKGTNRFDARTTHDLVKLLEKQLPQHTANLSNIATELRNFGTEHRGIWVYGTKDDEERLFRRAITEATTEYRHSRNAYTRSKLAGKYESEPRTAISSGDPIQILAEDSRVGDWFVPASENESLTVKRAWRITYIKEIEHHTIGTVLELYNPFGDFIYLPKGTTIHVVRE